VAPEDFDRHLEDKTLFIAHGEEYHFAEYSLWIFSNKNAVRIFLAKMITWKYFELFITFLIILNSIFLGIMDYTDTENKSKQN
jgi:hypothetical protein